MSSQHKDGQGGHVERRDLQSAPGESMQQSNGSYFYHNGRRYHNQDDVPYVFPADDEENARIHKQHWIFKSLSGTNYGAPVTDALENGIKVHDAGCGPGAWSLDMANEYPNSTVYGTDILTRSPETNKPVNCHFKTSSLLTTPGNFPENQFGYIHQRLLFGGLPANTWEKVIEEHVRTLAPGGWLEFIEPKFFYSLERAPPKLRAFFTSTIAVLESKGLKTRIDEELEEMLRRAGLINIQVVTFNLPTGEATQLGNLSWEDISEAFKSMMHHGVNIYPEFRTEEKIDQFLREVREECLQHRPLWLISRVFGQKPPVE